MTFLRIFFILFCMSTLQSCVTAAVSAVATTGVLLAQERSVGTAVDDTGIWASVKEKYLRQNAQDLLAGVNVEVVEARVLLTGVVDTSETRIDAVRLAWQVEGVKEVINEIKIEPRSQKKLKHIAKDNWIATQLKTKMLFARNIRTLNYSIDVIRNTVYLMGIARDQQELDELTHMASTIKGVDKVVSHVRLKDNPERG